MSDGERVPEHGKADVAFAGAELSDAWGLIASIFIAMVAGSIFGWVAYLGIPVIGYAGTKMYIEWKSNNLSGFLGVVMYRLGIAGYSSAFDRKQKLFIGDSKIVNPNALRMGAIVREDMAEAVEIDVDATEDDAEPQTLSASELEYLDQ
jgi:hypothetical protein